MESRPILVWGAGAIGGILGAYWARAGKDVVMVDIDQAHIEACSTNGIRIEGPATDGDFRQVIPTYSPETLEGKFDCVVLAVKAQATKTALTQLLPHLTDDGFILSAQNGLNERLIAQMAGPDRTMGAFVNYGSDWQEAGRVLYGNRGAVVIGEIDGSIRQRTKDMHQLMQIFEPDAVLTDNIWGYLWGKLGYGAMLFATALTPDSMSANFANPNRSPALIGLAREVMSVALAEKIKPLGFNGFNPESYFPDSPQSEAEKSIAALVEFTAKTAKTHSGIWRDLAVRKRKTEVDPQIGIITQVAQEHGIETPLLSRLVELIHEIEDGKRPQSSETFDELLKAMK
ncbi:ketopantoate reductase family protein [Sneathiella limimaris]|uniref:ketopantoate reductase family protein n=1 Tax=Sneathiella limimaris TaxID=1964213 RepID=UPI00146C65E4|nr:2-dehydropantoate 2-reductase [Sneathiella limimaris]